MQEKIKYVTEQTDEYTMVSFELAEPILPEELKTTKPPEVNPTKGVIISGRGPIWLYGYLIHFYHHTKWIATHDPRLGGAVVVVSHTALKPCGTVVQIP